MKKVLLFATILFLVSCEKDEEKVYNDIRYYDEIVLDSFTHYDLINYEGLSFDGNYVYHVYLENPTLDDKSVFLVTPIKHNEENLTRIFTLGTDEKFYKRIENGKYTYL